MNRLEDGWPIFRSNINNYGGTGHDSTNDDADGVRGTDTEKDGRIRCVCELESEAAAGQANRKRSDIARSAVNWVGDGPG